MFTGLIEHLGTVSSIVLDSGGCTLTISNSTEILGDSCLTVTEFDAKEGWFKVWLANETLDRTDLGERKVGDQLNLERAMGAHVRFGGHFVQAHVDGTATVVDRVPDGDSLRMTFQLPAPTPERPSLLPYLIPKGYVTIDGASLTLTGVNDAERTFSIMLIQHTQQKITLSRKAVGATVNIEVDMVGKYVQKSVVAALGGSGDEGLKSLIEKVVEDSYVSSTPHGSTTNFRPKAKVNSSTCSTPRAGSPTKVTTRVRNGVFSPTNPHKASSTVSVSRNVRSPPPASAPVTPEARNRVPPTSSALSVSPGYLDDSRARPGSSASLHHAMSFSSFRPTSSSVVSMSAAPSHQLATLRIRSKVSKMAKSATSDVSTTASLPSSPLYPSFRNVNPRARAPSTSSTLSQQPTSPPLQFYPITTAVSAANPHRFATQRPPPAVRTNHAAGHQSPGTRPPGLVNGAVDPASIPLPPHSPPASSVSFSSRPYSHSRTGSTSTDNGSRLSPSASAQTQQAPYDSNNNINNPTNLRTTLDNLMQYTAGTGSADDEDGSSGQDHGTDGELEGAEDHKVKAAAKSNRKVPKEIHELRRKLRESRLILPPRAFRAVKSSLQPDEIADDEEDVEDEDLDASDAEAGAGHGDEIYKRIKVILDGLLKMGQEALEKQVKDFPEGGRSAAKVLSPEELKDYHGSSGLEPEEHEGENASMTSRTRSENDVRQRHDLDTDDIPPEADSSFDDIGDLTMTSEDEVEDMMISGFSPPSSSPPPIVITQPM
ncbi:hypothetical protein BDZ97DRAFT_1901432 [Flammula alnicola]|nr:hypothetical protein BDZ97DRAFT_1901432 [Flammula alnicola]